MSKTKEVFMQQREYEINQYDAIDDYYFYEQSKQ